MTLGLLVYGLGELTLHTYTKALANLNCELFYQTKCVEFILCFSVHFRGCYLLNSRQRMKLCGVYDSFQK